MAIMTREEQYAKEVDDFGKLLVELVDDIRQKKPVTQIAAENLPNLISAMDNATGSKDEWEENRRVVLATVGKRTGELTDAIIGQKPA